MDVSAKAGRLALARDGEFLDSNSTHGSSLRLSGHPWKVNEVLRSLEYAPAPNWHGWDELTVTLSDLGLDGFDTQGGVFSYRLHLFVEAVDDPPTLKVEGLAPVDVLDLDSLRSDPPPSSSSYLVPAKEDEPASVFGVSVEDLDAPELRDGTGLSSDSVFTVVHDGRKSDRVKLVALQPRLRLSISCAHGAVALGGVSSGLVVEVGDPETPGKSLVAEGAPWRINEALAQGIVYTPEEDWHGVDLVEVGRPVRRPAAYRAGLVRSSHDGGRGGLARNRRAFARGRARRALRCGAILRLRTAADPSACSVNNQYPHHTGALGECAGPSGAACASRSTRRPVLLGTACMTDYVSPRSGQVSVSDSGDAGRGSGAAEGARPHTIALAVDVAPANDAPEIIVPPEFFGAVPATAEEDRVGVVGMDCCGWSPDNAAGATAISKPSVVLTDADVGPEGESRDGPGERDPPVRRSRWALGSADGDGTLAAPSPGLRPDDTVSLTITANHGGVRLDQVLSGVSVTDARALDDVVAEGEDLGRFYSPLTLVGPLWDVARAVRGMRYRSKRNWNSWVGSGGRGMEPVVREVSGP